MSTLKKLIIAVVALTLLYAITVVYVVLSKNDKGSNIR